MPHKERMGDKFNAIYFILLMVSLDAVTPALRWCSVNKLDMKFVWKSKKRTKSRQAVMADIR